MKTLSLIFLVLAATPALAYADGYSQDLFAQNVGTVSGRTEDSSGCSLKIYYWAGSYDVEMEGQGFSPENGTSAADSAGEFKHGWLKSYVEATYGGWINSKGGVTPDMALRIYFKGPAITAYQIIENNQITATCTLNR